MLVYSGYYFLDFTWNAKATALLLEQYRARVSKFRDPKVKKRGLWLAIQKEFEAEGYFVSEGALDRKWRNMKKRYCGITDEMKRTGRGPTSWMHYRDMEDILVTDCTANIPVHVISTIECATPSTSAQVVTSEIVPLASSRQSTPGMSKTPTCVATQSTPSTRLQSPRKAKAAKISYLQRLRKRHEELENERVTTLKGILEELRASNEIQRKRNEIMEQRNCILANMMQQQNKQ